jgi:hypothetical protein
MRLTLNFHAGIYRKFRGRSNILRISFPWGFKECLSLVVLICEHLKRNDLQVRRAGTVDVHDEACYRISGVSEYVRCRRELKTLLASSRHGTQGSVSAVVPKSGQEMQQFVNYGGLLAEDPVSKPITKMDWLFVIYNKALGVTTFRFKTDFLVDGFAGK